MTQMTLTPDTLTQDKAFSGRVAAENQLPYWLALTQIQGLGSRSILRLMDYLKTPQAVWEASEKLWNESLKARNKKAVIEKWQHVKQTLIPEQLLETYQNLNIKILPISHSDYPPLLKQIYDPPAVLFVRGGIEALTGKTLAFVGTRKMTPYGQQVTENLITGLKPVNPVIVSGLALGVDGVAHRTALQQDLKTVAVFGCGIDQIFPASHQRLAKQVLENDGALVSEYGLGVSGQSWMFPKRNRIVAGLSYGTVVIEGPKTSGAMITAKLANEENRTVFALPGNIYSPNSAGPHQLIQQGATMLTSAADILKELNWQQSNRISNTVPDESTSSFNLTDEQKAILKLIDYEPTTIESIQQRSLLPIQKIRQIVGLFEIEGLVVPHPGGQVSRL